MKNFKFKLKSILLIFVTLFSAIGFYAVKISNKTENKASAYVYETDSIYLSNLANDTEKLESAYNLSNYYPLVSENQTSSNFCWIYSSMKALESSLMIQTGEYYNFSEIGLAYLYYSSNLQKGLSTAFDVGGNFNTFVTTYQDNGLILESDISNDEFENFKGKLTSENYTNYSYINSYATKELNSIIKPYEVSRNSFYSNLAVSAKRNIIKRFVKKYGAVFSGIEGGNGVGCFYPDNSAEGIADGVYNFYAYDRTSHINASGYQDLGADHAVTVIGWNDDVRIGSENGAFLVMNSWGFDNSRNNNSFNFFYVPYSYEKFYSTFNGFIIDSSAGTDVTVSSSEQSTFTDKILKGNKEIKNYFCYDDEISVTYGLNFASLENVKVKITSGKKDLSRRFRIALDNSSKSITVSLDKSSEFYGGYYSVGFFDGETLLAKRGIYVFSGTEIGSLKYFYNGGYSNLTLNNAFLNANNVSTINVSSPKKTYFMTFNLANITSFSTIAKSGQTWKDLTMSVSDISITSSTDSSLESRYTSDQLESLMFLNHTVSSVGNSFILEIGVPNGLELDSFENTLLKFKLTITSVLYDNCERDFYLNMFISSRSNAETSNLYDIIYVLNGGENDIKNITKYPNYKPTTESFVSDPDMTTFNLFSPTKLGSNFMGWYLTEDFSGEVITKINSSLTGTVTLYAKWDEIDTNYYDISLSLASVKDYNQNTKDLSEEIIYGDSIVVRFDFTAYSELSSYENYSVFYYFYGTDLETGYLIGNSYDFSLNFPNLKSGRQTFKIKVIVKIENNLEVTKETSASVNIAKKVVSFSFTDLTKTYNGLVQKPSVVMVDDFYSEDKAGKIQEDLFELACNVETVNVGEYEYFIKSLKNSNYSFDANSSKCLFVIEERGILLNWKEYNQVYDGKNHFPEYDVLGIIDGDRVSFEFTISECKNAGKYKLNIKPETISNRNYKVGTVEDFEFEIKKAQIKIIMHNATDRVQTKPAKRTTPTYSIVGNYYTIDDLQLIITTEAKASTKSGIFTISCTLGNETNYDYTVQKATYTLTGYYYVYYQLSNGNTYAERVEEGKTPKGVTKEQLKAPVFSEISYSDDYEITGNDIFVAVSIKDYSAYVYTGIFIGLFIVVCLIFYFKKRESKVR